MVVLEFDRGTLLLKGIEPFKDDLRLSGVKFDPRVQEYRATAHHYRNIVMRLRKAKIEYQDDARNYADLELAFKQSHHPYPHQSEAVETWWKCNQSGVVVLPTGSGKTFVAQLMMQKVQRSTLVLTPTIDLMQQWYSVLGTAFDETIGLVGGGNYEVLPITISTYDSAYLHMERFGNQFGFIVFDECHHLPSAGYSLAAECCLAPFRVGLTATPERADGEHRKYNNLIGPIVYRKEIKELAGDYLADYETVILSVELSAEEREHYQREREIYRNFLQERGIQLGSPSGWIQFLSSTSASAEGRRAFLAYRNQKEIAHASEAKIRVLKELLIKHRNDRALIFTNDNQTVYRISRELLIPAITHQTNVKERHQFLKGFNSGEYPFLVTSKVLNEGVDVPAANIGIVLSGSGSVREHVQRLGRILRRGKDKAALLYEVVAEDTAEQYTSQRRTQHSAYQ